VFGHQRPHMSYRAWPLWSAIHCLRVRKLNVLWPIPAALSAILLTACVGI
jgi:hypothetical protein